jgi:hypothetical protein
VLLVVVGAMGLVDLSGYSIPGPSYFAAALAVVGLGLIVGAWLGRAHGLIALGVVLIVLTKGPPSAASSSRTSRASRSVITSFDQLEPSYAQDFGNATLDLSRLDFRTAPGTVTVDVEVNFGNVEIIVPPDVDVVVNGDIQAGNADVFDQSWGGIDPGPHSVTDLGDDGRGGGELHINATIDAGNLEVRR